MRAARRVSPPSSLISEFRVKIDGTMMMSVYERTRGALRRASESICAISTSSAFRNLLNDFNSRSKTILKMLKTFVCVVDYQSRPITHAPDDLSSHIGSFSEGAVQFPGIDFQICSCFSFVICCSPFKLSVLFCAQGGACGCNETSIIVRLAEQVKQGAPGVDGKPGMPGLPVSSLFFH